MIYTTNWIERLNRDYKRVINMRGAMPNPQAVILLMGTVAQNADIYKYPIYNFLESSTYSGAYPFTFRQPIKHKIAFKSTILYPFIP